MSSFAQKIRDAFGQPNLGAHEARLCGFARNDILATLVGSAIVAMLLDVSFLKSFIVVFAIGELLHILFGVDTAFIKLVRGT